MQLAVVVTGLYGLLSGVGGLLGYTKAGSRASLIAGTSSGLVLLVCAYGMMIGNRAAAFVSLTTALLLGGRFIGTWIRRHRMMPDLIMVLGAAAVLITVGRQLLITP